MVYFLMDKSATSLRVSRYLSMQLLVNVIFGTAVGIGLYLIGVPNAILWGILAATLKFVPYLGAWIAAVMPVGLSMAISTNWAEPSLTIGLFVLLEFVSGNVVEPWLYGKHTGVSAVAVLLAAALWTWLWGVVGLLLATPLTVCLLVIGKHVPQLSFLDTLLGNEPVFEPKKRVYQRLVAGDQEEATELLYEYLELSPVIEVYDTVLIPALVEAETRWHCGELGEERHKFILQSLKEMIQEQGEHQREIHEKETIQDTHEADADSSLSGRTGLPTRCILCLPAHDTADEIVGMMLAQTVEIRDCLIESVPATTSAKDLVELVAQRKPDVVCISATPPSVVMRARNLCTRLRRRYPEVPLVVGLWDAPGELNKAKEQIGDSETIHVVTTLADAEQQIRTFIHPHLVPCPIARAEEQKMAQQEDLVIDKTVWDDLQDSTNLAEKDDIEERAKNGTLIVKDGDLRYRPVEVPEAGWELQKLPSTMTRKKFIRRRLRHNRDAL